MGSKKTPNPLKKCVKCGLTLNRVYSSSNSRCVPCTWALGKMPNQPMVLTDQRKT